MKNGKIRLKIGVVVDSEGQECEYFDEIGEFLALELYNMLENGEDYLEVAYLGCEKA